jgi:hypothetical protein
MMLTLIEAIAGRTRAEEVARDLGLERWDARHASATFAFTRPFATTVLLNSFAFWNREEFGIRLEPGMDEVSLALVADAWSRTYRSRSSTFAASSASVRSHFGIRIVPDQPGWLKTLAHLLFLTKSQLKHSTARLMQSLLAMESGPPTWLPCNSNIKSNGRCTGGEDTGPLRINAFVFLVPANVLALAAASGAKQPFATDLEIACVRGISMALRRHPCGSIIHLVVRSSIRHFAILEFGVHSL